MGSLSGLDIVASMSGWLLRRILDSVLTEAFSIAAMAFEVGRSVGDLWSQEMRC